MIVILSTSCVDESNDEEASIICSDIKSPDECNASNCVPMYGKLNQGECWSLEFVSCGGFMSCNDSVTEAISDSGDCWQFSDSCLPPNFNESDSCSELLFRSFNRCN